MGLLQLINKLTNTISEKLFKKETKVDIPTVAAQQKYVLPEKVEYKPNQYQYPFAVKEIMAEEDKRVFEAINIVELPPDVSELPLDQQNERIRELAYYLWERDGKPQGNDGSYYWNKAEKALFPWGRLPDEEECV